MQHVAASGYPNVAVGCCIMRYAGPYNMFCGCCCAAGTHCYNGSVFAAGKLMASLRSPSLSPHAAATVRLP
jgi:hypothetical protein